MTAPLPALNINPPRSFGSQKQLIDLLKSGSTAWSNETYVDSDGYLEDVPNGVAAITLNAQVQDIGGETDYTVIGPAEYRVCWNGECTVVIIGDGTSNGRTVTPPTGWDHAYAVDANANPVLSLSVTNTSGSNANAKLIRLYNADDEADMVAGKLWNARAKNAVRGAQHLRAMDWNETSVAGFTNGGVLTKDVIEFSDMRSESERSWEPVTNHDTFRPPSAFAKLCVETEKDLYYNVRVQESQDCIEETAASIAATGFSGSIYLAMGNEVWNNAAPWANPATWLRYRKAEGLTIVDGNGNASPNYTFTINVAENTLESAEDISAVFADRSNLFLYYNGGNAPTTIGSAADEIGGYGSASPFVVNVKKRTNFELYLYRNTTQYDADNKLTLDGVDQDYVGSPANFDRVACALAECFVTALAIFDAEFGASRVIPVFESQAANTTVLKAFFEYTIATEPALSRYGAIKLKELFNNRQGHVNIAPYFETATGGSVTNISQSWMMANKVYETGSAWLMEAVRNHFTILQTRIANWQAVIADKCPNAKLGMYEGGNHLASSASLTAVTYSFTNDEANDTLDSASDISGLFETGDRLYFAGTLPSSEMTVGYTGRRPWCRVVDSQTLKIYPTQEDALADTNAYDIDVTGSSTPTNYTRVKAIDAYFKEVLLNSQDGVTLHTEYFEDVLQAGGIIYYNQFSDVGWQLGSQFALTQNHIDDETPVATWFHSLAPEDDQSPGLPVRGHGSSVNSLLVERRKTSNGPRSAVGGLLGGGGILS